MNISIPPQQLMEVDGISLIGNISAIQPKAEYQKGKIHIQWKALQKNGKAKIWLATTNNFKTGDKDKYRKAGEFSLANEKADIDVKNIHSKFYKIVIETPGNMMNRWIVLDKRK